MENNQFASVDAWSKYAVNRKGEYEVLKQPLYDYQQYVMAGVTSQTFFAIPQGQGGKTLADTNMESAGQLPNPKRFLVRGIEIFFVPGVFPSLAPAQVALDTYLNDVWEVFNATAWLELYIGSKAYVQAPVNMFPQATRLSGWAAQSSGGDPTVDEFVRSTYAAPSGTPFGMDPPLILEPTQNFKVTINYPTAVGISVNGRIGVHLKGLLYRQSQ